MANYHNLKNAAILTPTTNTDLGSDANRYSNVYMSGNIVMSNGVTVTSTNVITPKITSLTLPGTETAVATAGGATVTITGSGFSNTGGNPSVLIGSTPAASVTYISATSLTFTTPPLGTGVYVLYVINSDGGAGIFAAGLNYSGTPTWSTASGSIGSVATDTAVNISVTATGDVPITYSVKAGSTLPSGLSLNSSTGAITGTAPTVANATTYNFTLTASDLQNQTTDRNFSIDVVTTVSAVEYLVVAGGGGGGCGYYGGGGGAGGYRTDTGFAVTAGSPITVTVGVGGTGSVSLSVNGANGTNSVFSTITSIGGGGGASRSTSSNGNNGGSGGGASFQDFFGGNATVGQGNNGGDLTTGGFGGSGGGAGAAGTGATNGVASPGGIGLASSISGTSTYYAGGGGGGKNSAVSAGGLGGGGSGGAISPDTAAVAGTTNTGGGGGGGGNNTVPGANGGSGVVIIRYTDTYSLATSTTGSPTITTAGGYRIYKFTASGTITF